jgi:endonuclease-3
MSRSSSVARAGRAAGSSPPDVVTVVDRLARVFPDATTELNFSNAFELLVATILSAQSTDSRVNLVTPTLFARYPDARALASADPTELETLIKATGFFRTKARALIGAASRLAERHGGEVPPRMDDLIELPGVGRKTANVVLGHALGVPGLPVDRHVFRVANRLGISRGKTPEEVEQELAAALPPERWTFASDSLILHGRRVCRPQPLCHRCALAELCLFYRSGAMRVPGTRAARRAPPPAVPEKPLAAAPRRPPSRKPPGARPKGRPLRGTRAARARGRGSTGPKRRG